MLNPFVKKIICALYGKQAEVTDIANEVKPENRFFVISAKDRLRWIIPNNPSLGWPALQQWRPYRLSSSAKWHAITTAYNIGQLGHIPNIQTIGITTNTSPSYPSISKSAAAIYIGTPSSSRKIVATLVDRKSKKPISIFKAPLDNNAPEKILHEAKMLNLLSQEKSGLAPNLISMNANFGTSYQKVISGKQSGRSLSSVTLNYLVELKNNNYQLSFSQITSDIIDRIPKNYNLSAKNYDTIYRILNNITNPKILPAVWVHGDFAPWNIINSTSGKVFGVDWEDAIPNGLPLFDLVHFYTQQAVLFNQNRLFPKQAYSFIRQYLEHLGINEEYFQPILLACLATDWLRSIEKDQKHRADFFLSQIIKQGDAL